MRTIHHHRFSVMPGFRRASTSHFSATSKTWMAGTSPAMTKSERSKALAKLVLALVDQSALGDPGHHGAEALADLFHLVAVAFGAHRLERGLVDAVLQHPILDELAGLDVGEDLAH